MQIYRRRCRPAYPARPRRLPIHLCLSPRRIKRRETSNHPDLGYPPSGRIPDLPNGECRGLFEGRSGPKAIGGRENGAHGRNAARLPLKRERSRLRARSGYKSVFEITSCLAAALLGLSLVLSAPGIALFVRRATRLFRVTCALPRILSDVTPGAPLLGLFCAPRQIRQSCKKCGGQQSGKQKFQSDHCLTPLSSLRIPSEGFGFRWGASKT